MFMRYWVDIANAFEDGKKMEVCGVADIKPLTDILRHVITSAKQQIH